MKITNFMLKKDGRVPYYLTEKEYKKFVEILEGKRKQNCGKFLLKCMITLGQTERQTL